MQTYTLKMFNTGQITLPGKWRKKFNTQNFIAEETTEGLLIKPLIKNDLVYFENKNSIGLYCEEGLPIEKIIESIQKIHGSN